MKHSRGTSDCTTFASFVIEINADIFSIYSRYLQVMMPAITAKWEKNKTLQSNYVIRNISITLRFAYLQTNPKRPSYDLALLIGNNVDADVQSRIPVHFISRLSMQSHIGKGRRVKNNRKAPRSIINRQRCTCAASNVEVVLSTSFRCTSKWRPKSKSTSFVLMMK